MLHLISLTLRSCALLLLVLGTASGYGGLALSKLTLPQMHRWEGALFGLGLGMGILSLLVLLIAALGLIYPIVIWAALVLGLVLAVVVWRQLWGLPAPKSREAPEGRTLLDQAVWVGLMLIIGLSLSYALFGHALLPPIDYDAIAYHLAIPKIYIEAHGLTYIPYIVYSNWPLGTEMLFLIGLILRSEALAQLISLGFALMLYMGLVLFSQRWLPAHTGWVAVAIMCSMQMIVKLVGTGLIEVPLTCYTFLAFYALWHWYQSAGRGWLVLSALLAGCAAMTKLNGASAAIIFATVALVLALLGRQQPKSALRTFVTYGLISFLVVLPWYIKSWAYTGNPLWPFLLPILGGRDWDELGNTYLLGYIRITNMPATFTNWLTGLWEVTIANGRFGSFLLGPYLLTLLPLGLLPAIRQPNLRPILGALLLVVSGGYTAWFLLTHQTRFLSPTIPFALLLGAAGLAWLWQICVRPLRVVLQLALLAWLLSGAWVFDAYHQAMWRRGVPYLLGQVDRETFLTSIYPEYPGFAYINQHLPPTSRVLLAPFEARGYYVDRAYIWANPISQRYLRLEQVANADALLTELRQRDVSHVLLYTTSSFKALPYREHIDILLSDLVTRHGHLLYEIGELRVYELDDDHPSKAPARTMHPVLDQYAALVAP
jgi:hypothetical protein